MSLVVRLLIDNFVSVCKKISILTLFYILLHLIPYYSIIKYFAQLSFKQAMSFIGNFINVFLSFFILDEHNTVSFLLLIIFFS